VAFPPVSRHQRILIPARLDVRFLAPPCAPHAAPTADVHGRGAPPRTIPMSSSPKGCGNAAHGTLRGALLAAHADRLERARVRAGARGGNVDHTGAAAAERAGSPPPVKVNYATEAGVDDEAADFTSGMDADVLAASEEGGSSVDDQMIEYCGIDTETAYVKAGKGGKRKADDDLPNTKSLGGKKGRMDGTTALEKATCGAVAYAGGIVAADGPSTDDGARSRMNDKVEAVAAYDEAVRGIVGDVQENVADIGHATDVDVAGCTPVKAEVAAAPDETARGAMAGVLRNAADDGHGHPMPAKDSDAEMLHATGEEDSTARESYSDQYAAAVEAVESVGVSGAPLEEQLAHLQPMTIDHRTLSRLMSIKTDAVGRHLDRSAKTYRAAVQWSAKFHMAMEALSAHGLRGLPSTSVASALEAMSGLQKLGSAPNTVVHRAGLAAAYGQETAAPASAGAHAGGDDNVDVVLISVTLAKDDLKLTPVKGVAAPAEQSEKPDKSGDL